MLNYDTCFYFYPFTAVKSSLALEAPQSGIMEIILKISIQDLL